MHPFRRFRPPAATVPATPPGAASRGTPLPLPGAAPSRVFRRPDRLTVSHLHSLRRTVRNQQEAVHSALTTGRPAPAWVGPRSPSGARWRSGAGPPRPGITSAY